MTRNKKVPCPYCPRTCSTPWNLKVHFQRAHQRKGDPVRSGSPQTSAQSGYDIGNKPTITSYHESPNDGHLRPDSKNLELSQSSKKRDAGRELIETMHEMIELKNIWNRLQSPPLSRLGQIANAFGFTGINTTFVPVNYNYALQFCNILFSHKHIGFRGHICYDCFACWVDPLYSNTEGLNSLIRSSKPSPHTCNREKVGDIEKKKNESKNQLISLLLSLIICCWFYLGRSRIYLKTEEITAKPSSRNIFELLERQNNNDTSPLSFWIDGEALNCNLMDVNLAKVDENHWASRAIKEALRDGRSSIEIDIDELMDYVRTTKATFGICLTDMDDSIRKFFIHLCVT